MKGSGKKVKNCTVLNFKFDCKKYFGKSIILNFFII